jgi:hypothetical protein
LDEYFNQNAVRETVSKWLEAHPFQGAVADDAEKEWMAK